ncbi:glycosyltransferase [Paenibacillus sp. NPDC058177]|uniref:glycosyltransferase n=1 Tax=Paenibacillus sp. NPDC058177 TaxID=3346369 RepID=UPI0036DD88F9
MTEISNNFEQEKKLFKDNIEFLISSGDIKNSKKLIEEYETFGKHDVDILSMKAIISIIENKLDDAEHLLWEGIKLDPKNKDVLFNLAYLYENKGDIQKAINFYWLVYKKTDDFNQRSTIRSTLQKLKLLKDTSEKKFIILSSCPWGAMLQRPHQIAKSLSKLGYEIEYVQPTVRASSSHSSVDIEELMKYSHSNTRAIELINIHTPILASYEDKDILNNYREVIQELIDASDEEVVVLCYFPSQVSTINQLTGNFKVVYECVDDHSDLEYSYWSSKHDREYEDLLLNRADIITTTSSALYLSKTMNKDNVFLSKNAVNIEDFNRSGNDSIPDDLINIPEPRVCYVGAVDRWFDEELFYKLVRDNKDKSFVVIGPVKEGILSIKENNLFILGMKEHSELTNYLRYMNTGIIPFKDDIDIIVNCDPIKMYEYVMSGLPVVATNMPELVGNLDFIKVSNGPEEFNRFINEAIEMKVDLHTQNEFIAENTWELRCKCLLDILDGRTEQYTKEKVVSVLRGNWKGVINQNPLLKSLYSLTFAETDIKKYFELARDAYHSLKISFTLNNFIYSSVLNNQIIECAEIIVNDVNLSYVERAELLFLLDNKEVSLLKVSLLQMAKHYIHVKQSVLDFKENNENAHYLYALGNYCYDTGFYDQAIDSYDQLRSKGAGFLLKSPFLNKNMCDMLIVKGKLIESREYKEQENAITKKYISTISDQIEKRCRFSVVIPTRNSHNVLKYTLMTCLNQSFEDYEIVISDNSSDNLTKELIEEFSESKIKYFRPERELAMTENYNFAISKAEGEYILVLGSDDGLLLHALNTLDNILYSLDTKIIHWNHIFYGWPDVKLKGLENFFHIPKTTAGNITQRVVNSSEVVENVLNFVSPYSTLPMLYCNAVVHRDLVFHLEKIAGNVFNGLIPDVYSGFALACTQEKFVSIDLPMSIGGSSGKSNGVSFLKPSLDTESKEIQEDFLKLNNGMKVDRFKVIPNVPNVVTAVAEAFLTVKELLVPYSQRFNLNRKSMIQICLEELDNSDNEFPVYIKRIYESLEDDEVLMEWFVKNYINNPDFGKIPQIPKGLQKGFTPTGDLMLDLSDFNITDVYGAAEMYRRVTGW